MNDMQQYLQATYFFDYETAEIEALYQQFTATDPKSMAIEIYYRVRDSYLYNPYRFVDGPDSFKASYCLIHGDGYCIPKAALMIALCRRAGIPARLGLADVLNHLATPKLLELLRTDVFTMHGYAELYLEGKWVKATPAFNLSLCEKFALEPLEFNAEEDSVFQTFSSDGAKHMEYLNEWGTFADMPVDFIIENLTKHYPHLADKMLAIEADSALEKE